MDASLLASQLLALQGGSVMVVGDVMLDRFVDGTVSRLSPEAPVQSLKRPKTASCRVAPRMWRSIWPGLAAKSDCFR